MGAYFTKEALVYTAFTVDALNTFVSFPLFVTKGPKWALECLLNEEEKKDKDQILQDVDRLSFQKIYDLFMVAYEGYFGFTASTLVCIYQQPTTIPIFSYSLFALYVYKLKLLWPRYQAALAAKEDTPSAVQATAKMHWVMFFFLPCYGGYCALHMMETAWAKSLLKRN